VAYLLIIVIVAVTGIAKITLQSRRETRLNIENDYRSSLQKVATQPLANSASDDGPRRRFELAGWAERKRTQEPAKRKAAQSSRRGSPQPRKRPAPRKRAATASNRHVPARRPAHADQPARVEWHSNGNGQIDLARDPAPQKLERPARRLSQPSGRGGLRTQFHGAIHPVHMPPPADYSIDPRAYDDKDSALWMAWERELEAESNYRRATASRRAG
jgi:hypothetical protein